MVINSLCSGGYSLNVVDANGQVVDPPVSITIPLPPFSDAELELDSNSDILLSGNFSISAGTITIISPVQVNGDYTYNLYDSNNPVGPIQTIISNTSPVTFTNLDCNGGSYYITYVTDNGCRFPTDLNERFEILIPGGGFFGC